MTAVNKALVVGAFQELGTRVMPQRDDAVRSVLNRMFERWFEERSTIVIEEQPQTGLELVNLLSTRAVQYAVRNMTKNYLAYQSFQQRQNILPVPLAHPKNDSVVGTRVEDTGFEYLIAPSS